MISQQFHQSNTSIFITHTALYTPAPSQPFKFTKPFTNIHTSRWAHHSIKQPARRHAQPHRILIALAPPKSRGQDLRSSPGSAARNKKRRKTASRLPLIPRYNAAVAAAACRCCDRRCTGQSKSSRRARGLIRRVIIINLCPRRRRGAREPSDWPLLALLRIVGRSWFDGELIAGYWRMCCI